MWYEDAIKKMVGKKLKSVDLASDKSSITFNFEDDTKQAFGVEGDCCSSSWIEHLERPGVIEGVY